MLPNSVTKLKMVKLIFSVNWRSVEQIASYAEKFLLIFRFLLTASHSGPQDRHCKYILDPTEIHFENQVFEGAVNKL